jgi:glycosyltransferase involved in cell wall biosynthesis
MRIMMIDPLLDTLPYDRALVGALARCGHDVLFCGRRLNNEKWDMSSVTYQELPIDLPNPPVGAASMRLRIYWWSYHIDYFRSLVFAIRKGREFGAEVIHVQWMLVPLFYWILMKSAGRRIGKVLTMHDTQVSNGGHVQRVQTLGLEQALRMFDRIIVHTDAGAKRLLGRRIEPEKIVRIPHGLLTADSRASVPPTSNQDETVFLLFGMLKPYKGIDILIKAVSAMEPALRKHCRFVVAGKAAMEVEDLISMAGQYGVLHFFDFRVGFIPEDDLPSVLGSADVFIYPYREIEASGAFMLSLQYGKPIIASNIGVFSEMLRSGVHGVLVSPEDVLDLAQALERLIKDKEFRKEAGLSVKRLAEGVSSWSEIAAKTALEYRKLVDDGLVSQH